MRIIGCVLLMFVTAQVFSQMTADAQKATFISADEAKSIVRTVLRHQHIQLSTKYCSLDRVEKDGKAFVEGYYSFAASCDYPNTAATTTFGIFVVSPRTGEVFKFDECKPYTFPALRRIQTDIVRRTHQAMTAEAEYRKQAGCE